MSKALEQAKSFFGSHYSQLLKLDQTDPGLDPQEVDKLIDKIEEFIIRKGRSITTNQLRNVFEKVKNVSDDDISGVKRLRPKVAYISARQANPDARVITEFINDLIKDVSVSSQLKSLKSVMEAMVAYHKLYHS